MNIQWLKKHMVFETRKLSGIILAVFLLLIPVAASAISISITGSTIGSIDLKLTVTPGIYGAGYYTDYQAYVDGTNNVVELFCVENEEADLNTDVTYYLFALDPAELKNMQAVWIAETYWDATSTLKGQAQLAIWKLLDVVPVTIGNYAFANKIYTDALDISTFDVSNWLLASNDGAQDYLMRAPVPEPATLMLLGGGLLGMGFITRRKIRK